MQLSYQERPDDVQDLIRLVAQELWGLWLYHWDFIEPADRATLKNHIDKLYAFSRKSGVQFARIDPESGRRLNNLKADAAGLLDQVSAIEASFSGLKQALILATDALHLCDSISSQLLATASPKPHSGSSPLVVSPQVTKAC